MYDAAILCEVKLDFTSFDGITYLKRYNGYIFDIGDESVMLKGYHINDKNWRIKFGPYDGRGNILNINMKHENDTKKTIEMVKQMSKCLYLFMNQYKPDRVYFDADRKSRQKIYERVVSKLIMQPEFMSYDLETKPSETDDGVRFEVYKK